ncbi:nicotinate phosphoribosyltransferase [Arachidicoccus ginsenosidivorans]
METSTPLIRLSSILDNDFYKFTMQCAVVSLFADVKAKYKFINRGEHHFPPGFGEALRKCVDAMSELRLQPEEKAYLFKTCPYLSPAYIDFLAGYKYHPKEVHIEQNGSSLEVTIEGYWFRTILWEVPLLSLISELFYITTGQKRIDDKEIERRTEEKIRLFNQLGVTVADFGTRRRHSFAVHQLIAATLKKFHGNSYIGTSNVHLARITGVKPIGTHAHEWFMFHGAYYGFKMAGGLGLENWATVFQGDLGVALSDTYTTDIFFKQFNKKLSKLFDGVRHDSGDPVLFAEKTIAHYKNLGINPLHKFIIFSDGLNPEKVAHIAQSTKGRIGISFGIGTNLTNDVGLEPMNIVIKLSSIQVGENLPIATIKLSDEKGKYTGDPAMIELAQKILGIAPTQNSDEVGR